MRRFRDFDLECCCALVLTLIATAGSRADAQSVTAVPAPAPAASPAVSNEAARFVPSVYTQFAEWKTACEAVPSNRALKFSLGSTNLLPLKAFSQFAEVLDAFFRLSKTHELAEKSAWLGNAPVQSDFFNTDAVYFLRPPIAFQPFVQREIVPAGARVFFHGDLHGDIHSVAAWIAWLNAQGYLRDFRIVQPDVYMVFLGDYTDRGLYGIEVLYTMLRLKLENPDRVWMVRGNHEDVSLASRYGFIAEGRAKYGRDFDAKRVMRLYDFFPVALYLTSGTNVVQCNHGGMEPGFSPKALLDAPEGIRFQLLGPLNQQQFLKQHPEMVQGMAAKGRRLMESTLQDFQPLSPTEPAVIGFMWNDFSVVHGEPQFDFDPGRAFIYGERPTALILEQSSGKTRRLQAVFRAHQHATIMNSMMRRLKAGHGLYRHWQENDSISYLNAEGPVIAAKIELSEERRVPSGSVWTFNVVPDSVYGELCDFNFDTFGILTTAPDLQDWRLRVVNQVTTKK